MTRSPAWLVGLGVLFLNIGTARAQPKDAKNTPETKPDAGAALEAEDVSPSSPRAALSEFFALTRVGNYAEAATYLEVPRADAAKAPELARKLKAVIDARAWVDPSDLSPLETGDREDGLPGNADDIAKITSSDGHDEPIRLVRRAGAAHWVFSRATVARIPLWYDGLSHRWALENLPPWLLEPGPKELLRWQWLALPVLIALCWLGAALLSFVSQRILMVFARRTTVAWDDALLLRMRGPGTLFWALGVAYLCIPWLGLYEPAEQWVLTVMRALFLIGIFWGLSRGVDVGARALALSPWAVEHRASNSLVPLGGKITKIAVLCFGVVAMLSELGYPVASLLAGLGIGGLAFALAAQKTVENLFGAFSIGADQPFREGDFVKIEDFVGTVERVGLRSTRVRTLDRTIITLPNGKLADTRVESYSVRDRMRLATNLSLDPRTTPSQMREVLAGLEAVLRAHPNIWPDAVTVKFSALTPGSLDIEVMAWFVTQDWGVFQGYRQEVLLSFMDVVQRAGTRLAVPTRLQIREEAAFPARAHPPEA